VHDASRILPDENWLGQRVFLFKTFLSQVDNPPI
jgi:hypothetical protein